jgi:hypothetical protein
MQNPCRWEAFQDEQHPPITFLHGVGEWPYFPTRTEHVPSCVPAVLLIRVNCKACSFTPIFFVILQGDVVAGLLQLDPCMLQWCRWPPALYPLPPRPAG